MKKFLFLFVCAFSFLMMPKQGVAQTTPVNSSKTTPPTAIFATNAGLFSTTFTAETLSGTAMSGATSGTLFHTMEHANGVVYAISRPAFPAITALGTINQTTGEFTVINEDVGFDITGMAWNPVNNTMYVVFQSGGSNRGLGSINLVNGTVTQIGALWGFNAMQLAASIVIDNEGVGFILDYGANSAMRFGTINLETGAITPIVSNINAQNRQTDMSIDRATGVIYVSTPGANTVNTLSTINPATGARTAFGTPPVATRWQAFVIFSETPAQNHTINITTPTNGTFTVMNGTTEVNDGDEIANGTELTLTATPASGFKLESWWDGNTNATRKLILTDDVTISATFIELPPPTVVFFDGTNLRKSTWSSTSLTTAESELLAAPPAGHIFRSIEFAEGLIYGTTRNAGTQVNFFGIINPTTGVFTVINDNVGFDISGLAWNPIDRTMYATIATPTGGGFGRINLTTGEFTAINANAFGFASNRQFAIAIDNDGTCFLLETGATSGIRFGTINLTTGALTPIVSNIASGSMFTELSIDRATNDLFAITPGTNAIFTVSTVNKTTGGRTLFGNTTSRWHTFVIFQEEAAPMHLVTITPPTNGTITVREGSTEITTGTELPLGTILTLTATPDNGFVFEAWWDGNEEASRSIVLTSDITISATFTAGTVLTCEMLAGGTWSFAGSAEMWSMPFEFTLTANIFDTATSGCVGHVVCVSPSMGTLSNTPGTAGNLPPVPVVISGNNVTIAQNNFTWIVDALYLTSINAMGAATTPFNAPIRGTFIADGSLPTTFAVNVTGATADKDEYEEGELVTLTLNTMVGATFREWQATGINASEITHVENLIYTFTMPANAVTLVAVFDEDNDGVTPTPGLTFSPWPNSSTPTGWIVGRPASGSLPAEVVIPRYYTAVAPFPQSWLIGTRLPIVGVADFNGTGQVTTSSMTSISIPETVEMFGTTISGEFMTGFAMASGLSTIILRGDNQHLELKDGVLYTKGLDTLILYPAARLGTSYSVNEGTSFVRANAFHSAQHLTEITLPNSVKTVGTFAFNDAPNLRTIYFNGVERLGTVLFRGTSNLSLYFRTTTPPTASIPAPPTCVGGTFSGAGGIDCGCITAIFVPSWESVLAYRAAWNTVCTGLHPILNRIRVENAFAVNVTGATAERNEYAQGELVTLTLVVPIGQSFNEWQATGINVSEITQVDDETFTFTMPNNLVTLTAVYEDLVGHPLVANLSGGEWNFEGSFSLSGNYDFEVTARFSPNGSAQLKADLEFFGMPFPLADGVFAPEIENYRLTIAVNATNRFVFTYYDKLYLDTIVWNGTAIAISSGRAGVFTPDATVTNFTVVVLGGESDRGLYGRYSASEPVTVVLNPPYNKAFKEWSNAIGINVSEINQVNPTTFTFTMPANNVAFTAVFEDILPTFAVTVTGAIADGERFIPTELVTLTLQVPLTTFFSEWQATGINASEITQVNATTYTFIMPENDVTLVAIYEDYPDDVVGTAGLIFSPWPNNSEPTGWIAYAPSGGATPAEVVIPMFYRAVAGQPQGWLVGVRLPVVGVGGFNYTSLTSISIPETVHRIGVLNSGELLTSFAFSELSTITLRGNNPYLELKDGVLYSKGLDTLILYPPARPGTAYSINEGTTYIQGGAFQSNQNLEEIIVSNSMIAVGTFGFSDSENITRISFGENLERLGTIMFRGGNGIELRFSSTTPPGITFPHPANGIGGTFTGSNNIDIIGEETSDITAIYVPVGHVNTYRTAWQNTWISNLLTLIRDDAPTLYTVTITEPTGGTIVVMNNTVEVESGNELLEGTELTLTATADHGFIFVEWWDGNTVASRSITLVSDTTISATFDADGTSIVIVSTGEKFTVFPNPTTDVVHIQTEQMIRQIVVLDQSGRAVKTLQGNHRTVNMQTIPAGNYLLRITTETAVVPIRVVKK